MTAAAATERGCSTGGSAETLGPLTAPMQHQHSINSGLNVKHSTVPQKEILSVNSYTLQASIGQCSKNIYGSCYISSTNLETYF